MNRENELPEFEPFQVNYPSWMKVLIPIAAIGFLGLGLYIIHLGTEQAIQGNLARAIVIPLGVWIVYLSHVGYDLTKYTSHLIIVSPKGIRIENKLFKNDYEWNQITFRARDLYEVLELFDLSKRRVMAIDYKVPGTEYLLHILKNKRQQNAASNG